MLKGKYYAPDTVLTEDEYNEAATLFGDRVYVEGLIPSTLKSDEEIEQEIAELEIELDRRRQERAAKAKAEAEDNAKEDTKAKIAKKNTK